jgi:hypothetical protein
LLEPPRKIAAVGEDVGTADEEGNEVPAAGEGDVDGIKN